MKGLKVVDAEVTELGFATLRQFFQFAVGTNFSCVRELWGIDTTYCFQGSSLKNVAEIAATACWKTILEHNGRRAGEFGLDTGQVTYMSIRTVLCRFAVTTRAPPVNFSL